MPDARPSRPAYSALPTTKSQRPTTPLLYYITDRHQLASADPQADERLESRILRAARAGVDYIQLREKDLSGRALEELAYEAMAAIEEARRDAASRTRLLVNGRVDIAIACGAAGVHLPSEHALSPDDARVAFEKAGVRNPLIGVSCHTADEVARAASRGADFAVFAPVFGKGPDARYERVEPAGIESLRRACEASLGMPVFALGAVTVANARECLRAGARGIAGIRLFQRGDVATTIEELRQIKP